MKVLEREHKKRLKAVRQEAEAGRRRQAKLFAELGVRDWTPEEFDEELLRRGGLYIRGSDEN